MPLINPMPQEVVAVFGHVAAEKFVDFLNSSFSLQREDVIAVSGMQFENRLVRETSEIRLEIAELRSETRTAIAEVRNEIAELRTETRTAIAELGARVGQEIAELRAETKADIAGVHKEIAAVHREIASLTKWMLAVAIAGITLYPIITRIVARLIPLGP